MNRTLPSLIKDANNSSNSISQSNCDVKVMARIKNNIFYKVFKINSEKKHVLPNFSLEALKKRNSPFVESRENLYEKIRRKEFPMETSLHSKEKKEIEVIYEKLLAPYL